MAESMNTKVDYHIKATSYLLMPSYGDVLIGDKAFEFYNEKNLNDYIQIPYTEIDKVIVSILTPFKIVPRFAIKTLKNGTYTFSTRDNKKTLQTLNKYIDRSQFEKSLSFIEVIKYGIQNLIHRRKN